MSQSARCATAALFGAVLVMASTVAAQATRPDALPLHVFTYNPMAAGHGLDRAASARQLAWLRDTLDMKPLATN